jgi:hypothetical protein
MVLDVDQRVFQRSIAGDVGFRQDIAHTRSNSQSTEEVYQIPCQVVNFGDNIEAIIDECRGFFGDSRDRMRLLRQPSGMVVVVEVRAVGAVGTGLQVPGSVIGVGDRVGSGS